MAKLPNTPDLEHLRGVAPSLISITAGTRLHRIYKRGSNNPTLWNLFCYFGPTTDRFDHSNIPPIEAGQGAMEEIVASSVL